MRQQSGGSLRFSPSDLITFLEGEFAAWMERAYTERGHDSSFAPPDDADPEMALIRDKGMHHEAADLEAAIREVLDEGHCTADLAGPGKHMVSTSEMGELVEQRFVGMLDRRFSYHAV